MGFWGRFCRRCDCTTGDKDPRFPLCWNCGAPVSHAPEYDAMRDAGLLRSPSLYHGGLVSDILKEEDLCTRSS